MPRNLQLTILLAFVFAPQTLAHVHCKEYPGSSGWPSLHTWSQLNSTIDGRLLQPPPPGAACHPGFQQYHNASECQKDAVAWKTYQFHADNPVSVMSDQFANWTCLPDPNTPCSSSGYPAYVVNATTAKHVKAGIDFAREHNLRLNVKSTGHDYLGRSNGFGALSIWVHHMNSIERHRGHFALSGSGRTIPSDAATVGGGTQVGNLYEYTATYGHTVVGGGAKTVSVGGYLTGGGHSILAPRYGLAADNVLQMEVVTPSGNLLVVNQDQHSDLFWALRGGGGSTFGVITSVTMRTHPTPQIVGVTWAISVHPNDPHLREYIGYIASQAPYLTNSGLSGYNYISKGPTNATSPTGTYPAMYGALILQDSTVEEVHRIFRPINDTLRQRWNTSAELSVVTKQYPTFLAWYNDHFDMGSAGGSFWVASRLLSREAFTVPEAELGDALLQAGKVADGDLQFFFVAGKGVQAVSPGENAVNPAWRKGYVHTVSSKSFEPFNETASRDTTRLLYESFDQLRNITPGSGSYVSESLGANQPDWEQASWGSHYSGLAHLKRQIDPEDVFWCESCVEGGRWTQRRDGRLCQDV